MKTIAALFAFLIPLACAHADDVLPSRVIKSGEINRELTRQPIKEYRVDLKRKGDKVLVPTRDKPLIVNNPNKLPPHIQQIPVYATLKRVDENKVDVEKLTLMSTAQWQKAPYRDRPEFAAIDTAQRRLEVVSQRALKHDATREDVDDLQNAVKETKQVLVKQYKTSVDNNNEQEQEELLETFRSLRTTGKALYGLNRDDRYPPETYQRIYDNSRGALAIGRSGQKPHCSGVLIGRDLALTNYHCIDGFMSSDLTVRFNYEEDINGNSLPQRSLPVQRYLISSNAQRNGMDFAVLELGVDQDNNHAGQLYPPQCLAESRVIRDDPLYLVGHPLGNPRTIHDNSFVYFPFQVTETEFLELEMLVRSEFLGTADEQEKLDEFRQSYKQRNHDGTVVYENFSVRYNGQPTIGADSDTFHGNSGSPAYNRRTQRVIGILFDGEDDLDTPWEPGWRSHEAILPMPQIIARMDAVVEGWRNKEGVCIGD